MWTSLSDRPYKYNMSVSEMAGGLIVKREVMVSALVLAISYAKCFMMSILRKLSHVLCRSACLLWYKQGLAFL